MSKAYCDYKDFIDVDVLCECRCPRPCPPKVCPCCCTGPKGPKGDKGETGAKGDKGETGAKGDKGETGAKGDQGETGAKGDKGETGAKGDQGETGAKGDKGETGAKGDKGETGAKGDKGEPGAKGDRGETGTKGDRGETGAKGDKGEPGAKGDKGETGAKGDKGEPGAKGETGATGMAATILVRPAVRVPYSGQPFVNNYGSEFDAVLEFGIPDGMPGAKGDKGEPGEQGQAGATGPTGTCECPCAFLGELIENGRMESFTNNIPDGWYTSTAGLVSRATAQGRVHSRQSAVSLLNGANLSQTIRTINAGCFYELSFFAHGEGANVSLTVTVEFAIPGGSVIGDVITIREQDMPDSNRSYGYYNMVVEAPSDAISATISFVARASGNQTVDLDDVSFMNR